MEQLCIKGIASGFSLLQSLGWRWAHTGGHVKPDNNHRLFASALGGASADGLLYDSAALAAGVRPFSQTFIMESCYE